jgi:O-methyltransferase involved in polyketide biosynthesis
LTEAGYDPAKKTLFLWEGVTFYLSETEVRKIMRSIIDHSFKDNILLAVIYAIRMLNIGKTSSGKHVMGYAEEQFGFGLDLTEAWRFVSVYRHLVDGLGRRFFLWEEIVGKALSWCFPKCPDKGSLPWC